MFRRCRLVKPSTDSRFTVTLEHVENWDRRLVEFARAEDGREYEWGLTDCAALVRRGLQSVFGEDVWKGHVGTWTTRRGAVTVAGKTDYEEALLASGAVEVGFHYAWAGDVVLGGSEEQHGMLTVGLLVPTRKVITSTPRLGVVIVDKLSLEIGSKFFRYGQDNG